MSAGRISVDRQDGDVCLPEDRRIQVKSAEDLAAIANKLGKPILHELVDGPSYTVGSDPTENGSHILAVYDGAWVYYCKIQAEDPTREGPRE